MRQRKRFWRVSVVVPASAEDAVSELFSRVLETSGAAYHDFETGKSAVSAFIADHHVFRTAREGLRQGLKRIAECGLITKVPRLTCGKLRREDWAESWKRHFKPIEISRRLLVKPSWSPRKAKSGQAVVVLDPGLSFGTGNHPTTGYCLRELVRAAEEHPGNAVLDAGTGSGILAIAAAKLGFSPVDAFDFDADAITVAKGNARRNHVGNKIHFFEQDATSFSSDHKYGIICANLSTQILEKTLHTWASSLAPAGRLVLAGVLKTEFSLIVRQAEQCGLLLRKQQNEKEWTSGTFACVT